MQRVQAGRHLHALGVVDGLAVAEVHARLVQRRMAVREAILHNKILRHLGIDERRNVGIAAGDDGLHVLKARVHQLLLDDLRRTGGNLVNHAPREGDTRFVIHIRLEIRRNKPVLHPRRDDFHHARAQFLAVVGAVVHADHGNRHSARLIARVEHCRHDRHRVMRLLRPVLHVGHDHRHQFALHVAQRIALLGDGEGRHLQRRRGEHVRQLLPLRFIGTVRLDALGNRRDDFLLRRAVGFERHHERHAVMRHINLVDNVIVERFRRDDAGFRQPRVQQALLKSRDKAAEDVARAKMHPHGLLGGLLRHLRPVVLRQRHLRGGIALLVLNALIGQFHIASPLCYPLIILFPNENAPRCAAGECRK